MQNQIGVQAEAFCCLRTTQHDEPAYEQREAAGSGGRIDLGRGRHRKPCIAAGSLQNISRRSGRIEQHVRSRPHLVAAGQICRQALAQKNVAFQTGPLFHPSVVLPKSINA